jgi:hypothetical protein
VKPLAQYFILACLLPLTAMAADQPKDRWIEKTEIDKVTDDKFVYVMRMADDQVLNLGNWVNKNWPTLMMGCKNRQYFFAVRVNKTPKLNAEGKVDVIVRYGSFKPVYESWRFESPGAIRMVANPINASVALTRAEKFYVRYTPKEGTDVTMEFTTFGVKDHLPKIAQSCGWNYEQAFRQLH